MSERTRPLTFGGNTHEPWRVRGNGYHASRWGSSFRRVGPATAGSAARDDPECRAEGGRGCGAAAVPRAAAHEGVLPTVVAGDPLAAAGELAGRAADGPAMSLTHAAGLT